MSEVGAVGSRNQAYAETIGTNRLQFVLPPTRYQSPQLSAADAVKYQARLNSLSAEDLLSSPELWKNSDGTLDKTAILALVHKIFGDNLEATIESEKSEIKTREQREQALIDARLEKIRTINEKVESKSTSSLVSDIIGWVVAAASLIVGVVVTVATLGVATEVGIAISLIGLGFAVTLTALSESGVIDMMVKAMAESLTEDFKTNNGLEPDQAELAGGITAQALVTTLIIAIDLVLIIASFGAATGSAATATEESLSTAAEATAQTAQTAGEAAEAAGNAAQLTSEAVQTSQELSALGEELAEEAPELAEHLQQLAQLVKGLDDESGVSTTESLLDESLSEALANAASEADAQLQELASAQQAEAVAARAEQIQQSTSRQLKYVYRLQAVTQMLTAAGQVANAGVRIDAAEQDFEAAQARASAELDKAYLARLRQLLRANQQFLRELVEALTRSNDVVVEVLKANHRGNKAIANVPVGV